MKPVKLLIAATLLIYAALARAQMVSYETNTLANYKANNQAANSLNIILDSFSVTLTQPGPIQINGFVNNTFSTSCSLAYQLVVRIDGTVVFQSPYYDANQGSQSISPITYALLSASLPAGAHTVEIAYTSAWTWGGGGGAPIYVNANVTSTTNSMMFASNEPSSGITEALDELRAEFLAADAALRAELLGLMNAAIANLQNQINAMDSDLQGQIDALQASLNQLQTTVQSLQEQIANLPPPLNYDSQIAALQAQLDALENQGSGGTVSNNVGGSSGNNNNWWWGVAAGAGAGVGAAILAEQFSSQAKAASERNASNPPGYYEKN